MRKRKLLEDTDAVVANDRAANDVFLGDGRGGFRRSGVLSADTDVSRDVVMADFDGDGWTDLYVTSARFNALLWNDRDGTFTEGAEEAGVDAYQWQAGAAAGDLNGDGRIDLGQELARDGQVIAVCTEGDDRAADRLLTAVYEELRRLAAQKMANEKPGGHGERSVAVGVLDMALWDLAAKLAGVPLWRMVYFRGRLRV